MGERARTHPALGRLIASGFCIGYVPLAPGTVASFAAVLIGGCLMLLSPYALPAAFLLAALGGVWAVRAAGGAGDPGWVVIDEFAGQWAAMLALPRLTPAGLIATFVLFRLVDIAKPGPVGWADRRKTAMGVMGDDVLAGLISAALIWAAREGWPGLLK